MFKADCLNQVNIMHHVSLQNVWIVQLGSPSHGCEMQQFSVSEKAGRDMSAWTRAGYKWWIGITAFTVSVQFYQFPEPLAQKTSPAAMPYEDSTFTCSGLALCLHLPMDWKCSHFFFQLWSTPMISTPCFLTFILFKRTPIHLPSLFKENCPLSVHSTKSRVHGCRKLCFQTVSIMGQSHFHSSSHVHRRKPLPVWMQTSTTAACVGHCKSAKLAHFHH